MLFEHAEAWPENVPAPSFWSFVGLWNSTAPDAHDAYTAHPYRYLFPNAPQSSGQRFASGLRQNLVSSIVRRAAPDAKYKADLRMDPDFDPLHSLLRATGRPGHYGTSLQRHVGTDLGIDFEATSPSRWKLLSAEGALGKIAPTQAKTPADQAFDVSQAVSSGAFDRRNLQYGLLNDSRFYRIAYGPRYRGYYTTPEEIVNQRGIGALGDSPRAERAQLRNWTKIKYDYLAYYLRHPEARPLPLPEYKGPEDNGSFLHGLLRGMGLESFRSPGPDRHYVRMGRTGHWVPGAAAATAVDHTQHAARDAYSAASCHQDYFSHPSCQAARPAVYDTRCVPAHAAPLLINCHRHGGPTTASALGLSAVPIPGLAAAPGAASSPPELGRTSGNLLAEAKNAVAMTYEGTARVLLAPFFPEAAQARRLPARTTYSASGRALTVVAPGQAATSSHRPRRPTRKHQAHHGRNPAHGRQQALAFAHAHGLIPPPPAPVGAWKTTSGGSWPVPLGTTTVSSGSASNGKSGSYYTENATRVPGMHGLLY